MNKLKTITLKGISRTPYKFEIHPCDTVFSALSAVYAVLKRVPHGYSVIYLSHTCDLSECFKEHELKLNLDEAGGTHIGVRVETMASSRLSIHTDLLASYMPVCNFNAYGIEEERLAYRGNAEQVLIGKVAGIA